MSKRPQELFTLDPLWYEPGDRQEYVLLVEPGLLLTIDLVAESDLCSTCGLKQKKSAKRNRR